MSALATISLQRPASLQEATRLLAGEGARPLAGGTDLLPNLRRGLGEPKLLVDLGGIADDFAACAVDADGALRIGAGATLAAIAADARIGASWPVLASAAGLVAGPTHRISATLGGNLCQDTRCVFYNQSDWWRSGNGYCLKYRGEVCHVVVKSDRCYATYHGDVAPALMVLDAAAEIVGRSGARRVPIAELFVEDGARRLTLAADELIAAVHVPPMDGWRAGYEKARVRDAMDFPLAGVALAIRREGDRVAGLRAAITGTNSAPLAVPTDAFVGQPWSPELAAALAEAVRKTSNVLQTTTLAVKYRRRVLVRLTSRLATKLWDGGAADA